MPSLMPLMRNNGKGEVINISRTAKAIMVNSAGDQCSKISTSTHKYFAKPGAPSLKMIMNPLLSSDCEVNYATALLDCDADTVSTSASHPASVDTENQMIHSISMMTTSTFASAPPPPRRSIFDTYWQKSSSTISLKDDGNSSEEGSFRREAAKRCRSPKLAPSYLGVYSFAPPSPMILGPLGPTSDTDSLTPPTVRPKSILRRRRSLLPRSVTLVDSRPHVFDVIGTVGRPRSTSYTEPPESNAKSHLDIPILPLCGQNDDASEGSDLAKASNSSRVHFDPTITVRECLGEITPNNNQESNWFSDHELKTFMAETVHLCHSSAVDAVNSYSLPAVKKAYESAREAGVEKPILLSSSHQPEYRALFADPVLHATEDDTVVHDGSKRFFKTMSRETKRVLIVDNSRMTLKLFRRQILSMFPHVKIDIAVTGEDALGKIEMDSERGCVNYDLIIVEERLQRTSPTNEMEGMTGSELLRLVNEMEASASSSSLSSSSRW
eukprot:CAMPEP_0201667340 /NCGR_PEP_ID=MMETSP0494-20130426/14059_1 /ASSEMBLY_ACC=CAM_ASM_000839 /TAXON_ID=420259 /ORGANISM="Thalassiosira gravida, Strain GMp14c1" /LENGTH=495 /DNA_ID=CAMNT_0048147249 /DNA_START=221 /DNA_END=1705 /DNA_ORIENTATION=+